MANAIVAVDIRQLSFRYPDGTPALHDIELQVMEGQRLALLGPNGAGKSTLLLHLNGLLRGSGEVRVLGMAVDEPHLRAIRQQVGLVFQNPDDQLFMPTVYDEVAYAALNAGYSRDEVERRVSAALATAGIERLRRKHPANLSMGERKRVAIASVLVTDNRLLLLDEPSAGLDPGGRRSLMALLAALPTTMIIATHDLDLAVRLCPTAAAMKGGQILEVGPTERIASRADLFEDSVDIPMA